MAFRWWMGAAVLAGLVITGGARAQAPQQEEEGGAQAEPSLDAPEPARVEAAIEAMGAQGDRRAVTALRDRIRLGLPPALLEKAIEALGAIRRTDSVAALAELVTYRRPTIRAAVARALGSTGARSARRHLTPLLDDPSPLVRGAAAEALGEVDPRGAMRDLIRAARRGLPQAVTVVGTKSNPAQARALLREVDAESLRALGPALEQLATREDLPALVRIKVVEKVGELRGADVQRLLRAVIDALPEGDRVREAATEALEAIQAEEAEEAEGAEEPEPAQPAEEE